MSRGQLIPNPATKLLLHLNANNNAINNGAFLADLPTGMSQQGFETCNGKIYSIGGAYSIKNYEYDPIANTWATKSDIPTTAIMRQSMGVRAVGNKLYLISGMDGADISLLTSQVLEYDPATDTYTAKTPIPTPREDFGTAVIGTKIYCFGGLKNVGGTSTATNVLEIYDTATNTWDITKTSMPDNKILGDFGASCNGKVYAIGGQNTFAGYPVLVPNKKVYEYDPVTNIWTTKADIPEAACYREVAVIGNDLYIMSGSSAGDWHNLNNLNNKCYKYNTLTDVWTRLQDIPYSAQGTGLTVYNDKIYMCGGNINAYSGAGDLKYLFRFDDLVVYEFSDAIDSSGNVNNLTNYNSVAYSSARFNTGADFGTSNTNKKLEIASNLGIDGGNITMMCWVKLNENGNGSSILSTMSSASKVQYALRTKVYAGAPANMNGFYFARVKRGIVDDFFLFTTGIVINKYYHLALTYNGTTIIGYVNGSQVGTKAASGNGTATVENITAIGYQLETTIFGNYVVDEPVIENRVWTPAEIKKYYTGATNGFV